LQVEMMLSHCKSVAYGRLPLCIRLYPVIPELLKTKELTLRTCPWVILIFATLGAS
jgi:hypothetical protein